jgi:hypothetical protein
MRASRRVFAVALLCLSNFCLPIFWLSISAAAQQSDQVVAERVLGPHWKELSRRAGMIFAGTVLTTAAQTPAIDRAAPAATPAIQIPAIQTPAVELTFRVDRAIAGVEQGQTLTIHEWAGAWSMHRPMSSGQHILIFLYPPSRLGFTSPVGGSLGQVALDSSGKNVSDQEQKPAAVGVRNESPPRPLVPVDTGNVSVVQLERAIRSARIEEE